MIEIKDKKYKRIVKDIFRNNVFKKLYNIEHHGISRMEHSIKVSYYSYRIAKKIGLDYQAVARGGLLHDFFLDGDERNNRRKFIDTFTHPKRAVILASSNFKISKMEENIIIGHMFPFYMKMPKYKESILVNLVDKVIGSFEMIRGYIYKFKYRFDYLYILLLIFINNH